MNIEELNSDFLKQTMYQELGAGNMDQVLLLSNAISTRKYYRLPDTKCFERVDFIGKLCFDKICVEFGCRGDIGKSKLHERLEGCTKRLYSVDKEECPPGYCSEFYKIDVEDGDFVSKTPKNDAMDYVLACDFIEHLLYPARFLNCLRLIYRCPVIITIPNPFNGAAFNHMITGVEIGNIDHLYSWTPWNFVRFCKALGFRILQFAYIHEPDVVRATMSVYHSSTLFFMIEANKNE